MKTYRTRFVVLAALLLLVMVATVQRAQDNSENAQAEEEAELFYQQRESEAPAEVQTQLASMRAAIAEKDYSFEVAYTEAMDRSLEELTGLVEPENLEELVSQQNVAATAMVDDTLTSKVSAACSSTASKFDWRVHNGVTPVTNQQNCGSCWAFATHSAFEASYRILNNSVIDTAEQDTLDCNPWGYNCGGGWWAYQYLIDTGVANESAYPYTASKGTCKSSVTRPHRAASWGYVSNAAFPSKTELKNALCTYGPLAVAVQVTSPFQAYSGGVFNACASTWLPGATYQVGDLVKPTTSDVIYVAISTGISGAAEPAWPSPTDDNPTPTVDDSGVTWQYSGKVNHGVTLVGWDDSTGAWLIKNSWGTGWGSTAGYGSEKGYMWIADGCNNINYRASWVQAKKKATNCDN